MTRVGIVTGMAFEAECLRAALRRHPDLPKPRIQVTGARRGRAEATARNLIAEGATALLSFGVAGGLDPDLKPGDLIIADHILSVNGPILAADSGWVHAVLEGLGDIAAIRTLPILSVDSAVTERPGKSPAFQGNRCGRRGYGKLRNGAGRELGRPADAGGARRRGQRQPIAPETCLGRDPLERNGASPAGSGRPSATSPRYRTDDRRRPRYGQGPAGVTPRRFSRPSGPSPPLTRCAPSVPSPDRRT